MQLVEVDSLETQPAEALVAGRAQPLGTGVAATLLKPVAESPLVAITSPSGYGWSASATSSSLRPAP